MKISERRADQYGFVHFDLGQLIVAAQAMGKSSRLHGVHCYVCLKGLYVSFAEYPVELPMKRGVSLFYFELVHRSSSF